MTDSLASFAVWDAPDWGGCGNPTKWAGRNFWWKDGKLQKFELKDLFKSDTAWENKIRRLCRAALLRQGAMGARDVLSSEISINIFTLSSKGMQIYFNPYQVGSGADGEFVVHIPFTLLRSFLRKDGVASAVCPLVK